MQTRYGKIYNIKEVLKLRRGDNQNKGEEATVIGVATYTYSVGSSLIIQDVIDGEIYGYQIYGPIDSFKEGDIILAKGNTIEFYGLPELSGVLEMEIVGEATPFEPQIVTIEQINAYGVEKLMNEYVKVEEVTLPAHDNGKGSINFTKDGANLQTYRTPAYPMGTVAGDVVNVKGAIAPHRGNAQIRLNDLKDFEILEDSVAPRVVLPKDLIPAVPGVDYELIVDVIDNVGVKSLEGEFETNGVKNKITFTQDEVTGKWKGVIPEGSISGEKLPITFKAIDVNDLVSSGFYKDPFVYNESTVISTPAEIIVDNNPKAIVISPKAGSSIENGSSVEFKVNLVNGGVSPDVTLKVNGESYKMEVEGSIAKYTVKNLPFGEIQSEVVIKRDGVENSTKWSFYIGADGIKHYFGQIHSHSNFSDGAGTPVDAFNYVIEKGAVDFFALTDHSNYFDSADNLGTFDNENSGIQLNGKSKWKTYKEIIEGYNNREDLKGKFLALYGFEMTWTKSGIDFGHMNTFETNGFVSRNDPLFNEKTESKGLIRYYDAISKLEDKYTFSQWNHPGDTFGSFGNFAHYKPEYDKAIHLVEVGNGESKVGSNGYWRSYSAYDEALAKGWRVAPSNNQDNHKGKWGDANTTRTVVLARELTKESIVGAIRSQRVYATEDDNFKINYKVNDRFGMGDNIPTEGDVKFSIGVEDPDSSDVIGTVSRSGENGEEHSAKYYYVKVVQQDGDIAVTAPVWSGEVKIAGVDSVKTNKKDIGKGESVEVSVKFRNDNDDEVNFSKVDIVEIVDGVEKILATTTNVPAAQKGETDYKFNITPENTGTTTIYTRFYESNGNIYDGKTTLVVIDKNIPTSTIKEVAESKEDGKIYKVEGILTSNSSELDKNIAFFDSGYLQDETGGINIFPLTGEVEDGSGNKVVLKEGDKVVIYGRRSSYQGERQINIDKIEFIEYSGKIEPEKMTVEEIKNNLGKLVTIEGVVESYSNEKDEINILVKDGENSTETIRVFVDGYIGRPGSTNKEVYQFKKGDKISATGLSSMDPLGNRIRVRNREDIKLITDVVETVDKSVLQKEVEKSSLIKKSIKYINASNKSQYDFALKAAKIILEKKNVTQEEVDLALKNLRDGAAALNGRVKEDSYYGPVIVGGFGYGTISEAKAEVKTEPKKEEKPGVKNIAYIKGYPDKTVKPDGLVTRAEAVTMVASLKGYSLNNTAKANFKDAEDTWYNKYLNAALKEGLLIEKEGEEFRPDDPMTRGEFAQLISTIDKATDTKAPFEDVVGHKYEAAINKAYGNKRIVGFPDGTFKPDGTLTRSEAAVILNSLFNREVRKTGVESIFTDLDKNHWAFYELMEATREY